MNVRPEAFSTTRVAIVEGKDDVAVLRMLLAPSADQSQITIRPFDTNTDWPRQLVNVTRTRGFGKVEKLLLVRDSDSDPRAAIQSMRQSLTSAKLPVPAKPGEWATAPDRRIATAILTIPGDNEAGELEDMCLRAVAHYPCMGFVDRTAEDAKSLAPGPRKLAKFRLQTFLACQPSVFDTLAAGLNASLFAPEHAAFGALRAVLQELAA